MFGTTPVTHPRARWAKVLGSLPAPTESRLAFVIWRALNVVGDPLTIDIDRTLLDELPKEPIEARTSQVVPDDEETQRQSLLTKGYRISDPITIDGVHIGFLAVKFDAWNVAEDVLLISAIPE